MSQIGRYELADRLAHGGSGEVYRAFDPIMRRHVALKIARSSEDPSELAAFNREAATAGSLHHPNVISVFDVGIHKGLPYLVMELLDGHDLQANLTHRTKLPLLDALNVMRQAAMGLHHAHTRGIVHRDVAPRNIWLLPDGVVKVIDFGLAGDTHVTGTSRPSDHLGGTVPYSSPERFSDSATTLDPRSDVFSYGVIFYELICGHHPFLGADDRATICNITMREPAALEILVSRCPEELALLLHRALAKDPASRYPSFEELLFDLEPLRLILLREKAERLTEQARSLLAGDRMSESQDLFRQVLSSWPDHKEARRLYRQGQEELNRRALIVKIDQALAEAAARVKTRDFEGAISLLERLPPQGSQAPRVAESLADARSSFQTHKKVLELLSQSENASIRKNFDGALGLAREALLLDRDNDMAMKAAEAAQAEIARNRQFEIEFGQAQSLIATSQWVEAMQILDSLQSRFSDRPEVVTALTRARAEQLAIARESTIENATRLARSHAAFGEFDVAITAVEQTLQTYPGDRALERLLAALQDCKASSMRAAPKTTAPETRRISCVCGTALEVNMKFCDHCGRRVEAPA